MPSFRVKEDLNIRPGPGVEFDPPFGTFKKDEIIEEASTEGWVPVLVEDEDGVLDIGWVSKKYLVSVPDGQVPTTPTTNPIAEPIWIRWARAQLGQKEIPGPASNPVIQAWYHLTTLPEDMWTDATAWCAVFVNAALMLNNIKTIRSARAFDWLDWGKKVSAPQKGDVVVFNFSHVAFYLEDAGDRIRCIGGNQNDAVTITTFTKTSVKGYRRAT